MNRIDKKFFNFRRIIKNGTTFFFLNPYNIWKYRRKKYKNLKKIFKKLKREEIIKKTIVFNVGKYIQRELDDALFLAKILALNGAKVKVLLDDGILKHWDMIQVNNLPKLGELEKWPLNPRRMYYKVLFSLKMINNRGLYNTRFFLKKLFKAYKDKNIKIIYYSKLMKKNEISCKNLEELKNHALSSTIRFFKNPDLDFHDKYVRKYYILSLKNAAICRHIGARTLKILRPDYFINEHGIYSTHGPAFDFLKSNGIKCLVGGYTIQFMNQYNIYFSDTPTQQLTKSSFWQNYKNTPLNEEIFKKIETYFEKRLRGNSIDMKRYSYMEKGTIFKVDKNDGFKYHVAMFPNVIWDGNIKDRHTVFNDIIDWLISTINYVKNRGDIKLYIKGHPSEEIWCNKTPKTLDILHKYLNFKDIKNVVLIPSNQKIDTYKFLKSGIDLGLVYDSFLNVEIPYLKIPTITCVNGGKATVEKGQFIVKNKEQYFNYLDNIDDVIKVFNDNFNEYFNNVVRYIYWFIFENPIGLSNIFIKRDNCKLKTEDFHIDKKFIDIFR